MSNDESKPNTENSIRKKVTLKSINTKKISNNDLGAIESPSPFRRAAPKLEENLSTDRISPSPVI